MRLDEQGRILMPVAKLIPTICSRSAYNKARVRESIEVIGRGGGGHPAFVVFDTMPDKYKSKIISALGDPRELLGLVAPQSGNNKYERIPFNELTPKELQLCNAKYNIVKTYRQFAELHGAEIGVTAAKKEFIAMLQGGSVCAESYAVVGKLSFQTVERWNKELRDGGDVMDALAPLRAARCGTSLTPEQKQALTNHYCKDTQPTFADVYRTCCRFWKVGGMDIPSESGLPNFICRKS